MEDTLIEIRKLYGDEAIFLLNQFPEQKVEGISTGSLLLDNALGVGGVPRGRYTELFGVQGTGKTTMCQHLVANAQKTGLICAFIDIENAVDISYARDCGVDFDSLYLAQPNFAEDALGIAELLIKDGEVGLIVLDSVAALSPKKESEDEFEDKMVTGMQRAKLLNSFFRRTVGWVRKNRVAVVFTNQMRVNIGSFFGGTKPPGGMGLKHYASVRIKLSRRKAGEIKSDGRVVGQDIGFIVVKNKVAVPYGEDKFSILFGRGIDREADIITCSTTLGILTKRGAYLVLDGEVIGRGKANTITAIKENPELANDLETRCRESLSQGS